MMCAGYGRPGLGKYEAAFRENGIDETVLPNLTAEDLKDLGVSALGHRRKLLDAIAALRSTPPLTLRPRQVLQPSLPKTPPSAVVSQRSVVRRPPERPPRAVARLVPVPRLISVARPVKVPFVTPGIIARSIRTRRGSRRHARFLALGLRSRRGIGRGRYCIVEGRSRGRILDRGSLGERGSAGRTLRCRGRDKLAWLRMDRRPRLSFLFSGILRQSTETWVRRDSVRMGVLVIRKTSIFAQYSKAATFQSFSDLATSFTSLTRRDRCIG